jgi:hypothetical protein
LSISSSNIIIHINLGESINIEELRTLHGKFREDIIKDIMAKFEITQINRIGYIRRYLFKIGKLSRILITKTIGGTLDDVHDINLRFSKKYPASESLVKKDVNDYDNAIYTIVKKASEEDVSISLDYQRYFDPSLDNANQLDFTKFMNSVDNYNSVTFMKWLNEYYGENND